MNPYGFFIIDPLGFVNWGDIPMIAMYLAKWLDPIVTRAGYSHTWVCFPQVPATPSPRELMVYICSFDLSVVQHAPGARGQIPDPKTSSHKGITWLGPPAASEVYIKETNPLAISALIFHEAMHNKLQTNNSLHGLYPNPVLSAAMMNITAGISPNAQESAAMASALNNPVPQWTGGQSLMWKAAADRQNGDELWNADLNFKY